MLKKKIKIISLIILLLISLLTPIVNAENEVKVETTTTDQVNPISETQETVTIKEGDEYLFQDTVTVDTPVDGNLFIIANIYKPFYIIPFYYNINITRHILCYSIRTQNLFLLCRFRDSPQSDNFVVFGTGLVINAYFLHLPRPLWPPQNQCFLFFQSLTNHLLSSLLNWD